MVNGNFNRDFYLPINYFFHRHWSFYIIRYLFFNNYFLWNFYNFLDWDFDFFFYYLILIDRLFYYSIPLLIIDF